MVLLKAIGYAQNFFDEVLFLSHSSHLSDTYYGERAMRALGP